MTQADAPVDDEHARAVKRTTAYERSMPRVRIVKDEHAVTLATPTRICLYRAFSYFDKEPETIDWIAGMPDGAVLFDVGANVGLYTLWAALTRNATVFGFEPEAGNYATLNINLRMNGLTERCRAFCMGISDRNGFDTLLVQPAATGASGHQVGLHSPDAMHQGVVTTTLDHLVFEAGLPCPSHLKIDVDGLEPAIVRGAGRLLQDPRLKSVLIEVAVMDPEHRAVIDRLETLGFAKDEALEKAVYEKSGGVAHTGNIIFTRP